MLVNAFITCVIAAVSVNAALAYYGPESRDMNLEGARNKRYTDYQERASATCTGICMYHERKTYSDCFDLCNWTGSGPSPWIRLDREKARIAGSAGAASASPGADNSVDSMATMLRTGLKGKPRVKVGMKKANAWGY